jgi:hypothetical protein
MKNIIVLILLVSILIVIGILYYDSYSCTMSVEPNTTMTDKTNEQLQSINAKYGFKVSDGELPQFKGLLLSRNYISLATKEQDLGYKYMGAFRDKAYHEPRYKRVMVKKQVNLGGSWGKFNFAKKLAQKAIRTVTVSVPEMQFSHYEFQPRAIPTYTGNVSDVRTCVERAKKNNREVAGLQYYGHCFHGDSMAGASRYGRHYPGYHPLGTGWSNNVYQRQREIQTVIDKVDDYENVIKWLTSQEINIRNYADFVEFDKFVNTDSAGELTPSEEEMLKVDDQDNFTTLEGLEPTMPPVSASSSATGNDLQSDMFSKIKTEWEHKLSDPLPRSNDSFMFEFTKNAVNPDGTVKQNSIMNSIREFNKIPEGSLSLVRYAFKINKVRNTTELETLLSYLAEIGYKTESNSNLPQILTALNTYGRKGFELDEAFVERYKRFGLNSDSNLHEFLTKLIELKVSDPVNVKSEKHPLPFPRFAELVGSIGVNYGSFNKYCAVMDGLYFQPSSKSLEDLLKNVKRYFQKQTIVLDDVATFKKELAKYRTSYSEYGMILQNILIKVSIPVSYKEFVEKFVEYYNTDYIRNQSLLPISTEASSSPANTISFYTGITAFYDNIKSKGFVPGLQVNFLKMLKNYTDLNVPGNDIKSANSVIEPKQGFSTISEGMTTFKELRSPLDVVNPQFSGETKSRMKITEGMTLTYKVEGYYDAMKKLGITDHENIMIILPESGNNTPQRQTIHQFDARISRYLGAQNDVDRVKILSYMVNITAPASNLYVCLDQLQRIGINMNNFDSITSSFAELGLPNFAVILEFLMIINYMNVKVDTLKGFTNSLAEFECSYKTNSTMFVDFIYMLIFYGVTLTTSTYDIVNTKFDNFMYNMKLDGITLPRSYVMIQTMFKKLTNSEIRRVAIPNQMEQVELDMQLRDVIIRKDALLFGIDNTVNGKNSMDNLNSSFQLDTTMNIGQSYKGLTQYNTEMKSLTICPLYPVIYDKNEVDIVEVYSVMLKGGDYIKIKTLRIVAQMLNPYEFEAMKKSPKKLHVRSIMSRLCVLLKLLLDKNHPNNDVFLVLLFNSARTFPYKTFDYLQNDFKYSGTTMDLDNEPVNEGNIYTLLPPVKEPPQNPFTTIRESGTSYGNYQTAYSKNPTFPFAKISDTKMYESYDLSKTSFMSHSTV